MRIVVLVLFLCCVVGCQARAQDVTDRLEEPVSPKSWVFRAIGKLNAAGHSISFPLDESGRIGGFGFTRSTIAFALLDTYRGRFDSARVTKNPSKEIAAIRDRLFKEFASELRWVDAIFGPESVPLWRANNKPAGEGQGGYS
jgi:hypothetical protein